MTDNLDVMVVDDSADLRDLISMVIWRHPAGWKVVATAADGEEAVARARTIQPDLVLLDIAMPAMDGMQALPLIREACPSAVVVMLSGYPFAAAGQGALNAGAHGYLEKSDLVKTLVPRIERILETASAVTDSRVAERALRDSDERNRLAFEYAPIGEAIVELDGRWRQVNSAVTKLLGYSEEQLLAMTYQDITHPDDLNVDLDHRNRLMAGEITSYQIEKRYFTATGRIVWVLLAVALVRDDDGTPLYFISQIHDITDRKRQQRALQDLTAMLAHDLRAPATVIHGFAEILGSAIRPDEVEVRNYAARIASAARSMTDLLDNALTTTTLDSGELVATPKNVPLRELTNETLANLELGATSVEVGTGEELDVWVDPIHLNRILTNLLTNAAKYGGDTVTITISSDRQRAFVSIADNGPGVESDFVPHLFDRFSRSASVRRGRNRGSGLGLYIVRDLLAANGGSIHYSPRASGGAEFTIELCRSPPAPSLETYRSQPAAAPTS